MTLDATQTSFKSFSSNRACRHGFLRETPPASAVTAAALVWDGWAVVGGVHECAGGVGLIGNAGGQRRGGSPACWSCVRSSPLNDPAAPARRRRRGSARWMMSTKTYGNPRWHWAEGVPHCGRPCAQGRLRSPPGAGLVFTTRRRTALAQQVGRACPPAQSGARARYERHAIAVLSQGSTWGPGGWGSSPRRPRQ